MKVLVSLVILTSFIVPAKAEKPTPKHIPTMLFQATVADVCRYRLSDEFIDKIATDLSNFFGMDGSKYMNAYMDAARIKLLALSERQLSDLCAKSYTMMRKAGHID